ncbi:hypothetical protein ACJVC5_19415 [Peredibacter sp. HCB2-198]|uniref:hypothetical protein n=1 Tax=Peredibacter sp. HCB2-198 TaxID=3383025 RepID=UPI0038B4D5E5
MKELAKHVPTVLFQTVEWNELAHELPKISRRIIQKEGYTELLAKQKELLAPLGIYLKEEPISGTLTMNKASGEKLLTLYFAQLFSKDGFFLDIRSNHFKSDEDKLIWHPSPLWTKFDERFRQGVLKVYDGFYTDKNDVYFEGLEMIGLIQPDWSDEDKNKLAELFRSQFGSALTEEMYFDLDHFKTSIIKLSDFMLKKKVKIPKDFLYLGIYLVTLYSSLEETHAKLPVRDIYLKVREQEDFSPQ